MQAKENIPIRDSVKVLLLNQEKELLLIGYDDPKTTSVDNKYNGKFWTPIGGKIEKGETLQEAALREIYEEATIKSDEIKLGPIVWFGEFDLILSGILTHIKHRFITGFSNQKKLSLENLTEHEKSVVKEIKWFSLEEIKNCKDIIYPIVLRDHIQDIMEGNYPKKPLELDLGKQAN